MRIKAQIAMVMNLDKCIGCHTCSIPCKQVWTSKKGSEYMWFNNVETKPGIGYPKHWEDQERYNGGWAVSDGELNLKAGGKVRKLLEIFHNPNLPQIDEYYDPWTYNYETLTKSPLREHQPVATPRALMTNEPMDIEWGPNWEDDLAGSCFTGREDVNFASLDYKRYLTFRDVFMFWLPRICEHCLNPGCVASCPSGALYKRDEDGIVLVDQERCRGWRYCVSGCPYKKVYINWSTGRSEKCLFCYPRIEAGLPTLCAESCVGKIRYIGVILYDADRIREAASEPNDKALYQSHLSILADPWNPEVISNASANGVPENFLAAAKASPVYKLAVEWKLAFPPHQEFRTLPMVWYIPPLSPVVNTSDQPDGILDEIDSMRIPVKYLANLLSAGDESPIRLALKRLGAVRKFMRSLRVEGSYEKEILESVGLTEDSAKEIYHLLAIAKYNDRFVVPSGRRDMSENLQAFRGEAGFPEGGVSSCAHCVSERNND